MGTFLNVLLNLLSIKYLDTFSLGRLTLGKTVFQSFEFSHVGIRYGLDRILPHLEERKIRKEMYFTVAIMFSLLSSFLFVVFWFLYDFGNSLFYLIFSLSGLIYTIITIYKIYFRAGLDKIVFIRITFFISVLPIIIQILGLAIFNFIGYIIAFIISYLLIALIILKHFKINLIFVRKYLSLKMCMHLLKKGYILFIASLLSFFSTSGDKFFIAHYWGVETVGVFSVIMFFFTAISMFSLSYTELIMNKIITSPSFRFIIKHLSFSLGMTLLLSIICFVLLPYFVEYFIPKYTIYIGSIRLVTLAILPFSLIPILNYFMHAIDKQMHLLLINLFCTILYFVALYLLLNKKNGDIEQLVLLKFYFNLSLALLNLLYFIIYKLKLNKL